MNMKRLLLLIVLALLLVLSACTTTEEEGSPAAEEATTAAPLATPPAEEEVTEEAATPPAGDNELAGTRWTLVSFGPTGAETPVIEGSTVTLEFESASRLGGSGGCNSYGGDYEVEGNTISIGEIVSTLMACAEEGVTEQETLYLEALRSAGEFEVTEDHLTIWYDGGAGVLNFEPMA